MEPSQQTLILTLSQKLPRHEKLELAALRLRERYSGQPGYGPSARESEASYWGALAASNFNAWMLPPLAVGSKTETSLPPLNEPSTLVKKD